MYELRGVELRLERASEHIDALKHESRMFQMELPQPYGHHIPEQAIDGVYIARAKIFRPPPIRLGILAIDGAHNLRAALDMIAWELALKGENPPPSDDKSVAFPICTNLGAWESNSTERMLRRISADAVTVIDSFQPYHRPNELPLHWLALIQALDNWGKHKTIPDLMSFHISRMQIVSNFEIVSFTGGAFKDNDEICRIRRIEPILDPDEHFRALMMCHVGFSKDGPGEGFPIEFLHKAYEFIRDAVLPAFEEPFFR